MHKSMFMVYLDPGKTSGPDLPLGKQGIFSGPPAFGDLALEYQS